MVIGIKEKINREEGPRMPGVKVWHCGFKWKIREGFTVEEAFG